VIHIGIDDTDTPDTEGTNQLARHIARNLPAGFSAELVVRHQLLLDPRIAYTSGNGCASILVNAQAGTDTELLLVTVRQAMQQWFKPGSDPGLCMARQVAPELTAFGARCQREPVTQMEARALAAAHGVHLEALGGSEDGVIGALAASSTSPAGTGPTTSRPHDPLQKCAPVASSSCAMKPPAPTSLKVWSTSANT
jgi:tRNA(Ile2) C34 agmatinyltransferase TiaS